MNVLPTQTTVVMPDSRRHRGPHPEDASLFAPVHWPRLREATRELCWLLSRGYARPSALKLVGDRHQLAARQRAAVDRSACGDADRLRREAGRIEASALIGRHLQLDGYNVLTTVEVALGGGVLLAACDGTYRDIAGMHGTYRKVDETLPALELLGRMTGIVGATLWQWYFDRPVSNSGRLKVLMEELARRRGWPWRIELVDSPDHTLTLAADPVATADSAVLDRCGTWYNLTREIIDGEVPTGNVVPLGL